MPSLPITIRETNHESDSEQAFIRSYWKLGYRGVHREQAHEHRAPVCPTMACVPGPLYFEMMEKRIDHVLKLPGAVVLVACRPANEDQVYGFLVASKSAVHYVAVKRAFRGHGVARRLVGAILKDDPPGIGLVVTHWTRAAESYALAHPGALLYAPSYLEEP